MKFFTAALALASAANAHTLFSELYINGESQGDATCIRMPKEGDTATSPVAGLTNQDMACGKTNTLFMASRRSDLIHEYSFYLQARTARSLPRTRVPPPAAPS